MGFNNGFMYFNGVHVYIYIFNYLYIYRVGLNAVLLGINTGACSPYSPLYSYQTWLGNPKIAELNGGLKGWFSSKPSLITGGYLILIKTYQILPDFTRSYQVKTRNGEEIAPEKRKKTQTRCFFGV